MITSTSIAQQIILYYRVLDRTNESNIEFIDGLLKEYEEVLKLEAEAKVYDKMNKK